MQLGSRAIGDFVAPMVATRFIVCATWMGEEGTLEADEGGNGANFSNLDARPRSLPNRDHANGRVVVGDILYLTLNRHCIFRQ